MKKSLVFVFVLLAVSLTACGLLPQAAPTVATPTPTLGAQFDGEQPVLAATPTKDIQKVVATSVAATLQAAAPTLPAMATPTGTPVPATPTPTAVPPTAAPSPEPLETVPLGWFATQGIDFAFGLTVAYDCEVGARAWQGEIPAMSVPIDEFVIRMDNECNQFLPGSEYPGGIGTVWFNLPIEGTLGQKGNCDRCEEGSDC